MVFLIINNTLVATGDNVSSRILAFISRVPQLDTRNMNTGFPQTVWRVRPFVFCFLLAFVLWVAAAPSTPSIRSVVHGWAGFLVAVLYFSIFYLA
jgi:hypothetical protein